MVRSVLTVALVAAIGLPSAARAAERTVTLVVERMVCASCPIFVRSALRGVRGVTRVKVSQASKTATVTYDDSQAKVEDLIEATRSVGYPSRRARSGQ